MVCDSCLDTGAPLEPPFCEICAEHYEGDISSVFRCANCGDRSFDFEFATAGWRFNGAVRTMVYRFKYGRKMYLRRILGELLADGFQDARVDSAMGDWVMVPVPLHHRKFREREFNQAQEIARVASRTVDIPVANALKRTRYTLSQAKLSREERLRNLDGAFAMRKKLPGKSVFLVDDVFTTGATADECAKILKLDGGVEKVVVVTVARG